jgi:glycosyltransferase involved in cell wall biosynthesis
MARAAELAGSGVVLGYFPRGLLNPYQMLLYSQAEHHGVRPVALRTVDEVPLVQIARKMGRRTVLHIHWTSLVLEDAETEQASTLAAAEFLGMLDELIGMGVRIAWTVHNVLPHECPFPAVESALRQGIADRAEVIHVMNPTTAEAVAPHYVLPPGKTIEVPHPSYRGAYAEFPDRAAARSMMGYRPRDLVVGFLGSIKPYKGLFDLAGALRVAGENDPYMAAVVAGSLQVEDPAVLESLGRVPRLELIPRKTDIREVTTILRASDIVVLPYVASLNSGAALLAVTFGLPIIAPRLGPFVDLIDEGLGLGYEPGDGSEGLAAAMGQARDFVGGFDAARALAYAGRFDPSVVSDAFFDALLRGLGGGGDG